MKMELSQTLVLHKLAFGARPELDPSGRVVYVPNTSGTPYLVFDTHRDAPPGFAVKVNATKKTYIVQRRVGDAVIKAKVGEVRDFPSIASAREAASRMGQAIKASGVNPNAASREQSRREQDWTLASVFDAYTEHLVKRATKPAKPSSLRALEAGRKRLTPWLDRLIAELTPVEILAGFDAGIRWVAKKVGEPGETKEVGRSATEQAFRWASSAVRYAFKREAHDARAEGRAPKHTFNPFDVLALEGRFRNKAQLERDFAERGARNPLGVRDGSLGRFLEATWQRRRRNRQGADYLLLTLLLGGRLQETAALHWRDRITDAEALRVSWIDPDRRVGHFHNTKNSYDHDFPISDGALELLKQRRDDRRSGDRYVFPVRSTKKVKGAQHYTDPKTILAYVAADAGLKVLRTHDLRRTFGRIAEETTSATMVKRLLNHKRPGDATERYTEAEWERFKEVSQALEVAILKNCAEVYNALLPAQKYPRMEATDAHRRNAPVDGRSGS